MKKQLRSSSYNIVANTNRDDYIITHGYTKAMDIIPSEIAEFLNNNENILSENTFDEEEAEYMLKRGYITDLNIEDEHKKFKQLAKKVHRAKLNSLIPGFVIVPTYNCNLGCKYCFENVDSNNYFQTLSENDVDLIFKAYQSKLPKDVSLKGKFVTLFGGEPLLKKNKEIISYIVDKITSYEMKLTIVTNAVQLHHFTEILNPKKVFSLQITLDGPKYLHDKKRIYKNGKGTFDEIVKNIDMVLKREVRVNIRINIDNSNINALQELHSFFIEKGWDKNKFFNVYGANIFKAGEIEDEDILSPSDVDNYVVEKDLCISTNRDTIASNIVPLLKNESYKYYRTGYCSANYNSLIFDALGNIYCCWEHIGSDEFAVGNYKSGESAIDEKKLDLWQKSVTEMEQCGESGCKYALFCGGGCRVRVIKDGKNYYDKYCSSFKETFQTVVSENISAMRELEETDVEIDTEDEDAENYQFEKMLKKVRKEINNHASL